MSATFNDLCSPGGSEYGDGDHADEISAVPGRRGRKKSIKHMNLGLSDDDYGASSIKNNKTVIRRGRPPKPKGLSLHISEAPKDISWVEKEVLNDEIVLDEIDFSGEKKVNNFGVLEDGRKYRCRTFTVLGRGDRLYMLSTEPAYVLGYRDPYLFFLKHSSLYNVILNEEEKLDLVQRNIIPESYKRRSVGVVTARSVFREFGFRIIIKGKQVVDDYWESSTFKGQTRSDNVNSDNKLLFENMEYDKNHHISSLGTSSVYQYNPEFESEIYRKKRKVTITDENWMLEHARSASRYNSFLTIQRREKWAFGVYEPHTNTHLRFATSQPTSVRWQGGIDSDKVNSGSKVILETLMEIRPISGSCVHLSDIPKDVYKVCSSEILHAIKERQEEEKNYEYLKIEKCV
ncbi:hypothetical protein PNEG_03546 [Pneumocystis murina B123]|uniref:Uncharacterized protein n=1 Tax=Pneumocystis murina (strain B123) TaxID=1069680 RepID=M7NHQ9_PNEMU|nr:hypothetical protein PNEG_03546 [Pneumocystis murina B123]EMR08108.1 hypothetical protein PNEG_03546 [Pneumocystis murina B123]